ncbi:uncharacterized protein IL334_000949 [Kwoniella shivajii]|uniref:Ribonuclease P/MRP protein subunit POP5 n=1 Tax=Kwoniella shivajii TaxID=564305 RepID=A0ABZ1CRN5_9TREE|nr:hypothetical protein IL334_000949 [Kwoniella shivajii]
MVRFKNRYLLVEFLVPSSFTSTLQTPSISTPLPAPEHREEADDSDSEDDEILQTPTIPFLVPAGKPVLGLGDEGSQAIYKAVRGVIQDIFGDEGWARVASSFRVIYHSPLTTLTFIRIARPYYRLIWSALTFLTVLGSKSVIPRVVGVSGTIRKLQNRGISYHRLVIGQLIAHIAQDGVGLSNGGGVENANIIKEGDREIEEMERLNESQ